MKPFVINLCWLSWTKNRIFDPEKGNRQMINKITKIRPHPPPHPNLNKNASVLCFVLIKGNRHGSQVSSQLNVMLLEFALTQLINTNDIQEVLWSQQSQRWSRRHAAFTSAVVQVVETAVIEVVVIVAVHVLEVPVLVTSHLAVVLAVSWNPSRCLLSSHGKHLLTPW